jgi:hypothetical protein
MTSPGLQGIKHDLVDVAPTPILSGLKRFDDGVADSMKMFRGMFVG